MESNRIGTPLAARTKDAKGNHRVPTLVWLGLAGLGLLLVTQAAQATDAPAAIAVSAGEYHTCVLKSNGNVDCYGDDTYGQDTDYSGGDATAVSAGGIHTCVLKSNGNVDCFGNNGYGQGADYTGGDAAAVSAGLGHTCVLKSNGNVDCYGDNYHGQSADYTGADATAVSAGGIHTCVLKSNGNVDCYGNNYNGQANDYLGGDAVAISTGSEHTCVLKETGYVECYGRNDNGQAVDYMGTDAVQTSAGWEHSCALRNDGNVDCYGFYGYGQGGDYTGGDGTAIATGGYHTCVLKSNGNVDCYGQNDSGQADDYGLPSPPGSLTATAGTGTGQVTLAWQAPASNDASSILSYRVYRGTTSGGEELVASGGCSNLGNVLTCTDSDLGDGVTRYYKVSAINAVGEGGQSSEASATTFIPPMEPQTLIATAGYAPGQVTLLWQAPASDGGTPVTSYLVYRGTASGAEALVASGGCSGLGNVLTCTDSDCPASTVCYYQVSAINAVGEGPRSNEALAPSTAPPAACPPGTTGVIPPACAAPPCPSGLMGPPGPGQLAIVCGQPVANPCPQGADPSHAGACGAALCPAGVAGPPSPGQLAVACGTGISDPVPPDADGDGVPDAQEPALCAQENPNILSDGHCAGGGYTPPTHADLVSDVIWLVTGSRP